MLVPPALGVGARLERRGRRTEQRDRAFHPGADDGDVASVIARRLVLLVRAVVFLVDDDEAEVLDGREYGRSRADDDRDIAAPNAVPLIVTLTGRQPAVLNCDRRSEPRA